MRIRRFLNCLKSSLFFCSVLCFPINSDGSNFNENNSIYSSVSQLTNIENAELYFSSKRGLYDAPFQLILSSNIPESYIIYTTDCSIPNIENGSTYTDPIKIDSTVIIKARIIKGNDLLEVITHTYIFPSSTAKQGKSHNGFPDTWGGVKIIQADYEMDPEVINDPEYDSEIIEAFKSIPSLSLTMNTDEWFNHETGLYVGYKNTNITREKPVTAEFIFNTSEENFSIECGVQNQGGTSIKNWKSPKQSMRLLFKEQYGPTRLRRKLFPDSEINSINTLVVDAQLNHTWIHPTDDRQRTSALYFRDQLTSDLQNEMGWLSFHGRYFNLYLNGLYWGICDLHERPDDAFLSEYLDAEREAFDVLKHESDIVVSGTDNLYNILLRKVRLVPFTNQNLESIQQDLDLPAFIDYMILNFYMGNQDWARHNWYAGRNKSIRSGFRFYTWDAEHTMRFLDVKYNNTGKNDEGAPTEIHTYLKDNEEYRLMFADAVYKHMYNDGALTPENFEKSFRFRAEEIEQAIILESARWGDYHESVSGVTYTKNDNWIGEINKAIENYIPRRRDIVIEQFRNKENSLFPFNMPPTIQVDTINEKMNITLKNPNYGGSLYFTLDGTDPRLVGGGINGTKYSGEIEIVNSTILKARHYSESNGEWSALATETYLFDHVFGENIVINEIMYHPDDDYPEFIELMNFGESPVNLNGFSFSGGINYLFKDDIVVEPGAGLVLSDNVDLFNDAYNFSAFAQYAKQLSNSGEIILFKNGFNQLVDSVCYSDSIPWPELADGEGYSLELENSDLDNSLWSSWKASEKLNGTPYNLETKQDLNVEMFPNPFADVISIVLDNPSLANEKFGIEVYNQLGSKIHTFEVQGYNSTLQINLGDVFPGIYFLKVKAVKNSQFKSMVLKAVKVY